MYHYVRNAERTAYKGIKGCSEADFIAQVKHLNSTSRSLRLEDAKELVSNTAILNDDLFSLTFDDGLKEHALFVTEVLSDLNIPGYFFIPSRPILDKVVLPVHKNHFLLSQLRIEEYTSKVKKETDELGIELSWDDSPDDLKRTYRWDNYPTALLKYALNYKLDVSQREQVLDIIFSDVFGSEGEFAEELYVSEDDMRKMQSAGMIIGGHSHSHNVLSSLSNDDITKEIDTNFDFLENLLGKSDFWTFSYPFGKPTTYNDHVINELKRRNVGVAFNTVVADSVPTTPIMELNRVDPKDIQL